MIRHLLLFALFLLHAGVAIGVHMRSHFVFCATRATRLYMVGRRSAQFAIRALLTALVTTLPSAALASEILWVQNQSDCLPATLNSASFFDGTFWAGFAVPEQSDIVELYGYGPRTIIFGDHLQHWITCSDVFYSGSDVTISALNSLGGEHILHLDGQRLDILNTSSGLQVGGDGLSTSLTLEAGGTVHTNSAVVIGLPSLSETALVVQNPGTRLDIAGHLVVVQGGDGVIKVLDGGTIHVSQDEGDGFSSVDVLDAGNRVHVDGATSLFEDLTPSGSSFGEHTELLVSGGGTYYTTAGLSQNGHAQVTGVGSLLKSNSNVLVDEGGSIMAQAGGALEFDAGLLILNGSTSLDGADTRGTAGGLNVGLDGQFLLGSGLPHAPTSFAIADGAIIDGETFIAGNTRFESQYVDVGSSGSFTVSATGDADVSVLDRLQTIGGLIELSGPGANVAATGIAGVNVDSGSMVVEDGASLTASRVHVNTSGSIEVKDGASLTASRVDVRSGSIVVEDGASLTASQMVVDGFESEEGSMILRGDGTNIAVEATIVGFSNTARLTIEDGASLTFDGATIGSEAGSDGSMTIRDDTTAVEVGPFGIIIASSGKGALFVENGADLAVPDIAIGWLSGSEGDLVVRGAGSQFDADTEISVAIAGKGSLAVEDGASVTARAIQLGESPTSEASMVVKGVNTLVELEDAVFQSGGAASLLVEDQATLRAWSIQLGVNEGSNGTGIARGPGTSIEDIALTHVGSGGFASLTIDDRASFESSIIGVGVFDGGVGELYVQNGASIRSSAVVLGDLAESEGKATFHGSETRVVSQPDEEVFVLSPGITVGERGNASLLAEDGVSVEAHTFRVASSESSTATATIQGSATVVEVTHDLYVGTDGLVEGGMGTFEVADSAGVSLGSALKIGSRGLLDLTDGGRMNVGAGLLADVPLGSLYVGEGGFVGGTGTIAGDVVVDGGTVSPGFSPGELSIAGNYVQSALSALQLEIAGASIGEYDRLDVTGSVQLNGELQLSFVDDFFPMVGDRFDLICFGTAFSADELSVQWNGVPSGFQYDMQVLDGMIGFQIVAVPEPSSIALLTSATALVLCYYRLNRRRRIRG